jgi:hypothetical protein
VCLGGWLLAAGGARASGSFTWAPPGSPEVARGRQVATRFDQESLFEISVEVNNAFSLDNRRAIGVVEEELRRVPGVRRVFGPAALIDLAVDGAGRLSARTILDRGSGEGEDEAARQRVVRRADALGWFLSADGSRVRLLIDADDPGRLRAPFERAIASSGLQLLHAAGAHVGGEALWPNPSDAAGRWAAAAIAGGWILVALWGGRWLLRSLGRYPPGRRPAVIVAAFAGAGALFAFCAVGPVRVVALRASLGAALAAALGLVRDPPAALAGLAGHRPPTPPPHLVVSAGALVIFALLVSSGVQIGTQQWRATPFLFVSVRGDLEQPVVLREVRRLTDFLRALPGVDNAWSPADLFFGVARPGEEVSRIPDSVDDVRRLLVQARADPAVALEIAPDHQEALVVARFDEETPASRLEIHDHLARYLRTELRTALVPVDLSGPHLPAATRLLGRGLLAGDARERIVRISARSGRALNDAEVASVERIARQAAAVPAADVGKLEAEIGGFVRELPPGLVGGTKLDGAKGGAVSGPTSGVATSLTPAERGRLVAELGVVSVDGTVEDVRQVLAAHVGSRVREDRLAAMARALQPRLLLARQRLGARINVRAMLYGADLPTEGMLADEVRSATLEAMGPTVGIPVAAQVPGALHLDAMVVGGAANDRALSDFLRPALRWGLLAGVVTLAGLLIFVGGARGLLWLPVALAPAAVAVIPPALFREPVGMLFFSFLAGAFAGGAVWTVALAARRSR